MDRHRTRRGFLRTVIAGGSASLAGCANDVYHLDGTSSTPSTTRSSALSTTRSSTTPESTRSSTTPESAHLYSRSVREDALAVGRQLRHGVVSLLFDIGNRGVEGGTGWFVDDHYIVTNHHVVSDWKAGKTSSAAGYLLDGTKIDIEFVATTPPSRFEHEVDIALIRTPSVAPYVVPMGSASSLDRGSPVVMVGNPESIGNWVISLGEFRKQAYRNELDFQIPSTHGNSGSPIVDMDGNAVAMEYGGRSQANSESKVKNPVPKPAPARVHERFDYLHKEYALADPIGEVKSFVHNHRG